VLVLAVLALAIPIVASMTLSKVTPPPPVGVATAPVVPPAGVKPPGQELASLDTATVTTTTRHGSEPNPFRESTGSASGATQAASGSAGKVSTRTTTTTTVTKTPATKPTTKTPTVPKASKPASTPGSGATGATGSSGSSPASGTPVTGPATLKSDQAYSVDIDTKDATGVHVLSDVVRLAPLPDAESPEVIFLGVLQGGQKAAFLFTSAIAVSSKETGLTCLPSASDCQIVELSPGQGLSLYPTANSALIATFSFELVSIGATDYSSDSAATAARNAVSTAGQTLLPLSNSTELATLSFDSKLGALVHHSVPGGGSGNSGSTGSTGSHGATGASGASGASGGTDSQAQAIAFAVSPGH
jgi:collagen type VII alpha